MFEQRVKWLIRRWLIGIALVLGILWGSTFLTKAATRDAQGFRIAGPGYRYNFPEDHGSHPEFKIEWWYLTGHLWNEDRSRRFGYQATFFRRGIRPTEKAESSQSPFANNQVFLAHMAIIDVATGKFHYEERINRDGWDAQAAIGYLSVSNGNWFLRSKKSDFTDKAMLLRGSVRAVALFNLQLSPEKPKVIFGDQGVSRKGSDPSAASHYITFPRLEAQGRLTFGDESFDVHGVSWMDHEISSSQLDPDQVGWDWASVQLDSGQEVMVYVMRQENGDIDPYSTLAWIDLDGHVTHITSNQFTWKKTGHWSSPHSKASYPIESELSFSRPDTAERFTIRLQPLAKDQEIQGELGGIRYWEGACNVLSADKKPIGVAYVELTGYDGKLRQSVR